MPSNDSGSDDAVLPQKLAEVYRTAQDVRQLVKCCDFGKINLTDKQSSEGTLIGPIVPSLGGVKKEDVASMEPELKIAIAGATRVIRNLSGDSRDWDHVISALQQCPVLESRDTGHITRADRLVKDGFTWFRLTGNQDDHIVKEVRRWFVSLVQDDDILNETPIHIEDLANAVAATGSAASNVGGGLFSWNTPDTSYEKTVLDISVLRYPDSQRSFFKAYRIRLNAWSYSTHMLGMASNKNGLTGQFNCHIYHPRSEIIERLAQDTITRLSQEAEDLFA